MGVLPKKTSKGREDINWLLQTFTDRMGFKSASSKDRNFATHLLRNYTRDQLELMLVYCATDKYAPRVGSLEKLWYKRGDVIAGLQKKSQNPDVVDLTNLRNV